MIEIAMKNLKKYYGANEVLKDITFEIIRGDKVGIVGVNGSGKTTIFKVITGKENYEQGTMAISRDAVIGYLDQVPVFDDGVLVKDVLELAFTVEYEIQRNMHEFEEKMCETTDQGLEKIMKQYADLQDKFTAMGGYLIEERVSKICTGLKITEDFKEREFNSLSGGEKTTVMLGNILLKSCYLLLLDEPSNHLDVESLEWLEEYLREYQGTVIVISHDRYFLDKVVNKILDVEEGEVSVYHGNYSYFVEEKNKRLLEAMAAYKNQEKKIKSMEEAIKRFRQWGIQGDNEKFFKKAASIQKRLDKIERLKKPILERKKAAIDFNEAKRSGKDVFYAKNIVKAFDGVKVLDNLDAYISLGEKVAILGRNGCGKSTLIKLIMGEYEADDGEIKLGSNVKIGYLEQDVKFPNQEATVLESFRARYPCSDGEARWTLAKFLFYRDDVFKKVGSLSGGEKSRLRLCQLIHQDINTLILDEPTNHLDIESREMLEEALDTFNGTLIFISHDRYFVNSIAEKVMHLEGGKITEYMGNYDYYREKFQELNQDNEQREFRTKHASKEKNKPQKKIDEKANSSSSSSNLSNMEADLSILEKQIEDITNQMVTEKDYTKLATLQSTQEKLQKKYDCLLEKWLEYTG